MIQTHQPTGNVRILFKYIITSWCLGHEIVRSQIWTLGKPNTVPLGETLNINFAHHTQKWSGCLH